MKMTHVLGVVALSAFVSTSAWAGGFDFNSAGGNFGKWAYADGAAFGGAEVKGFKEGETESVSFGNTETSLEFGFGEIGTSAAAQSGNKSSFEVYGFGEAQSHSSAVAGSGVGTGFGFKAGEVNPE